ncbi:hypothetical protein MAR_015116 [Mya arenaria]|uniref:Uncharacterized protein n=1 Tax=Mya arenaria TaxID=6604 RepID=A0ABY7FG98_MYAAR|nr:hypothetical protein MAR_015116 [Mya arenaria]
MFKGESSLGVVRNIAVIKPESFKKSIEPVIQTINGRFSNMKLKGNYLKDHKGASDEEIESDLDLVKVYQQLPSVVPVRDMTSRNAVDLSHSLSGQNSFKIMKCEELDCVHCSVNPIRDQEMFRRLSFLPEPIPDESGKHYSPFREAQKVRDVIKCGDCNKPRLDAYMRRLKEDRLYICGDQLEEGSDLFMQRALNCTTDIEIPYFSPNYRALAVCCYCDDENNFMDDNKPYIQELYTKAGKEAKKRGQTFWKIRKK